LREFNDWRIYDKRTRFMTIHPYTVAMSREIFEGFWSDLRLAVTVLPRIMPRMILVYLASMLLVVVAMVLALTLSAPSIQQITQAVSENTNAALLILLFSSIWAILPIGAMILSALVYSGMIL